MRRFARGSYLKQKGKRRVCEPEIKEIERLPHIGEEQSCHQQRLYNPKAVEAQKLTRELSRDDNSRCVTVLLQLIHTTMLGKEALYI